MDNISAFVSFQASLVRKAGTQDVEVNAVCTMHYDNKRRFAIAKWKVPGSDAVH